MRWAEAVRKFLPIWVAISISLALIIGYFYPEISKLKPLIPFFLFVMLYPMMINLKIEDVVKAAKSPKIISIALLMNFLLAPLLGALWSFILLRNTDPYLATGFILKIVVPCSGMVAAWTGYARGKVETALIIVALSLLLAIPLVPFWMWLLARIYVSIDPFMILQKIFFIIILPLVAGSITRKMLIRKIGMEKYRRISPDFPAVSTLGMLIMIFTIISTQARTIIPNFHYVSLVLLGIATLYPLNFLLVIFISKALRIGFGDCMALGYSVTAKNHAITIGIAVTAFHGTLAVLPAAVAPLLQMPIMLLFLHLSPKIESFLA
ncbi:MAG: bile acid:sodium symporter [Candidatus Methanospirare jalkutatii]|nr:bile acid:sodium symporter [Candidatus Methanospirare jalkutatii]